MMNSLHKWLKALQDTIFELITKLPLSLQDKMKNKLTTYVKTYEEPETDENGKIITKLKEKVSTQASMNTELLDNQEADEDAEDL